MDGFSTKQKGDVAEYRVISECLLRGVNVCKPIGDRLPYDLVIEKNRRFLTVQVKLAWHVAKGDCYAVDVRSSNTNRRECRHTKYSAEDFDFLVAWVREFDVFYIFPAAFACAYGSSIHDGRVAEATRSAALRDLPQSVGPLACVRSPTENH